MPGIKSRYCTLFLGAAALVSYSTAYAEPLPRSGEKSGRIVAAKGGEEARLMPIRNWRTAEVRQDLKAGDILRTNASGTLAIVFADGTQIRLGRNSTLVVKQVRGGSPSAISLRRGKIWGRSPRGKTNLSVETPSATAAIRGTEWAISADEDESALQVFSGKVELFNDQGRLIISGGQAARALRGQAPTRVALANPDGREQMLYFIRVDDGLETLAQDDPVFTQAIESGRQGNWQQAEARFQQIAEASTEPRIITIAAYGSYISAMQNGQEAQQPAPVDNGANYAGMAFLVAYQGDLRTAITLAEEGLVRHPEEPALYEIKARTALLLGQPGIAHDAIEQALLRFPDRASIRALQAEMLLDYTGEPELALEAAQAASERAPENVAALIVLSDARLERGAEKEALAAIDKAIALQPQNASLYARRAAILLRRNELSKVKAALDRALEIDPGMSTVRATLAEYHARMGLDELALEEALAASADNPSFGRGFVTLAEIYYQMGQTDPAIQQLDTADRLDPNSPSIPLARTAIALHQFDVNGAITGAREALERDQARGGVYSNLSENQQTGSLVSQSFRFLNLESWGRYYGDRAFDSFSASSYPDQYLNRTPSPFLQRSQSGTFNAFDGLDADFVSSFIQGAVLEPLSVANPEKDLIFARRNFFEASPQFSYLNENLRDLYSGKITAYGLANGDVPVAYSISAERVSFDDTLPRPSFSRFNERQESDSTYANAQIGFELSPDDKFVFLGNYEDTKTINLISNGLADSAGINRRERPIRLIETDTLTGGLFWAHELGYRNMVTIGALYSKANTMLRFDDALQTNQLGIAEDENEFIFLTANYSATIAGIDMRTGVEFANLNLLFAQRSFDRDAAGNLIEVLNPNPIDTSFIREWRAYVDARYEIGDDIIIQGQLSYLNEKNTANILANGRSKNDGFNYQFGIGYEPVQGQWLRGAISRQTPDERPFSFAPVAAVGLKPPTAPVEQNARVDSYIARWDAEWTPQLFTSLEYQRQNFGALFFGVPSSNIDIRGENSKLDRLALEANFLVTDNVGFRASYAFVNSRAKADFVQLGNADFITPGGNLVPAGSRIPFVPEGTGQVGVTWALKAPMRLKTRIFAGYFGPRRDDLNIQLDGYVLLNATANWQPFDRAVNIDIGIFNLLDKRINDATGIPGPRRTIRVSAGIRF